MLTAPQSRALAGLVQLVATGRDAGGGAPVAALARALPDALVRRHFLAPLAYQAGIERFRRDHVASALVAELRARSLREVAGALAGAGIPVALLKGVSYVGRIYAAPAERPMSDIDLLVPAAVHDRAARVLRRLGFWRVGSPRQHSRLHHAVGYKRRGASIDLHRSIIQPWRSRVDVDALWRRAVPATDHDLPGLRRLAPVDELVIHLAHIARHELMVPAINYVDAARLLRRVDRDAVRARARRFRLGRAADAALTMTDALAHGRALGCRVLPSVREVLAYRPVWRPLQCLRKALLVEGAPELAGLVAVGVYDGLAHRLRP